jgi:2-phospho-L-lactate guanylyltransferase
MSLWAIVPVKPLQRGKSRLGEVLSPEQRAALSRQMLEHVLQTLRQVPEVGQTLVISRDPKALAVARTYGARTMSERGSPHLNRALTRATIVARRGGASAVLVLPADLPALTREEVGELVRRAVTPPVVAVVPDRRGTGTNALLSAPPGLIEYAFGSDSLGRHLERARAVGARVEVLPLASLGLDVDLPEDLELIRRAPKNLPN